ncbi:hypothetical protein [Nonomuraea rosea]|uniref:hypothetical protein n=1 Tax=Nonomuraea rosea TaxID=638574 RepID=UPI0031EF8F5A
MERWVQDETRIPHMRHQWAAAEALGAETAVLWLAKVLKRKAQQACQVRFLVGNPESDVTRRREEVENVPLTVSTRIRITLSEIEQLRDVPGVEVRFGDEHIAMSVLRFDAEMLVTPHLAKLVGHDFPMLHLRRYQEDGLFDRFAYHASELWSNSRDGWQQSQPSGQIPSD